MGAKENREKHDDLLISKIGKIVLSVVVVGRGERDLVGEYVTISRGRKKL